CWNAALLEIGKYININKKPVGENYERFHPAVEQHFQIALEPCTLIMNVGQNWKVRGLVQRIFNTAQNQSAKRVGHIENHHTDRVASLAAQRARKYIGAVAELLCRPLNSLLGGDGNVTGKWGVVEDDGNGGR